MPFLLLLAALLAACGRTELEGIEDIVSTDAADVRDAPDLVDVPIPIDRACMVNADCDDGVFCNGVEQCNANVCVRLPPVACDDGVPCTEDRCDEASRRCVSTPNDMLCMAPARCDPARGCTMTTCTSDAQCDDGNPCNGVETCSAGSCLRSPPPRCDDGVACTEDQCVPGRGCVSVPNDARCDDGVFCNGVETCSPMGCLPSRGILCEDGDPCTTNRCDERTRACTSSPTDDDGDGFAPLRCRGGSDCDDTNRNVNPGVREVCGDTLDNNCDGRTDCLDPACAGSPACVCTMPAPEADPMACRDGRDNDCDGIVDCAEMSCAPFCPVCVPTGPENTAFACADGRDNDCDGVVDCRDPGCVGQPPCLMCIPTGPENAPGACTDGRDNDCNGARDCADPACAPTPACRPVNDTCASPTVIGVPGDASGSTVMATDNFTPACAASMAPDVVYVFRNPVRRTITIDTEGSSYDTMLLVRRDNCDTGPVIACDDDGGTGTNSRVVLANLEPGTYYVVVDGWGGSRGAYQLHLRVGTTEVCDNFVDDDGDGLVDCADAADCAGAPNCMMCMPTGPENTPGACADGRDNDCDRLTDCADPQCAAFPPCGGCVPTGPENNGMACVDGRDNDCDGLTDCVDPDCFGVPTCPCRPTGPENNMFACADGRDNDCDRAIDCADTECAAQPMCMMCVPTGPENTPAACLDGRDNDCDRVIDCADPGCSGVGGCGCVARPEVCTDGTDNDCDRLVDCADPDCRGNPACGCVPTGAENTDAACRDGRDNDCDMAVDCADPGCAGTPTCLMCMPTGPENSDATCADGRDNDCDLAVDCMDPGCATTAPCVRPPANDNCASPTRVLVPSVTTGTLVGARPDFQAMPAPGCAQAPGPDVVYTFTVATTTFVTIDLAGTGFDPVLYVRRDTCLTGAQVACNDDFVGLASRVTLTATPGTYFVFVDSFGAAAGPYTLTISTGLPAEVCNNFRDDDGDGLTDCADTDCATAPNCMMCVPTGPENSPFACGDGRDNDCDRAVDCADFDCRFVPACCRPTGLENTDAQCRDGVDNNCNGAVDCADMACASTLACCRPTGPENTALACSDGRDNNCNGAVDCADPGCASTPACCRPTSMRETGLAQCTDGRDNDCDGQPDCADSDCRPFPGPQGECCNGRDDNGNTIIDEFACACASDADCSMVGSGGPFPSRVCYSATFSLCAPACNMIGGDVFCRMILPGSTCDTATGQCR